MRSTGIVRKLDQLGRVVLPMELRREHGITNGDPIEIFVDGEHILLEKFTPLCVFCGNKTDVSEYKGKAICTTCRTELMKRS